MFITDSCPPDEAVQHSLRVLRAPKKGEAKFLVTSRAIVGTRNHFYGGKTQPCMIGECDPCRAGMPWRWAGYFGIWHPPTNEHMVCEVPAAAGKKMADFKAEHGFLRGVKITLFRAGNRTNGRVMVNLMPTDSDRHALPKELDVESFLCHLWNVALTNTGKTPERGGAATLAPVNFDGNVNGRNPKAADQPARA